MQTRGGPGAAPIVRPPPPALQPSSSPPENWLNRIKGPRATEPERPPDSSWDGFRDIDRAFDHGMSLDDLIDREDAGLAEAVPLQAAPSISDTTDGSPDTTPPIPRVLQAARLRPAGGLARVDRLPTLKRAVAFAEILGPPKALQ